MLIGIIDVDYSSFDEKFICFDVECDYLIDFVNGYFK